MMVSIGEFPNLLLDDKVLSKMDELKESDKSAALTALGQLDVYGTLHPAVTIEPLEPKKKYSPIKELKLKIEKQEFRFLILKIPKKHSDSSNAKYAVLHSFIKKTKVIREKDKDFALGIKKREGY